jgi:hypothetical protein
MPRAPWAARRICAQRFQNLGRFGIVGAVRARRSRFGGSVPFGCSARGHARSERSLVMPRAGPLARLGATCPPARPRACAGKVKRKPHGALARAHQNRLDLAAFARSDWLGEVATHCVQGKRAIIGNCFLTP